MNQKLQFLCFWGIHNSLPLFWAKLGYSRIKIDHIADSLLKFQIKIGVHLIKVEPTATPYSDGTTAETNVTSEEATPESGSGEVNIENLQQSWRAPVFFIAGLCFCCIIFGGLMRPLEFVRESEEEKKSVSHMP